MPWPEAHDTLLRQCRHNGVSYSQTAEAINATFGTSHTKGAISARLRKLGLQEPRIKPKEVMPTEQPQRQDIKAETRPLPDPKTAGATDDDPINIAQLFDQARPCAYGSFTVLDLRRGMCRYPLGEDPILFCGAPQHADGQPYCAEHHALTHRVRGQAA